MRALSEPPLFGLQVKNLLRMYIEAVMKLR